MDHSIFRRNSTTSATDGWGGAILLWDGAQLAIQDSLFEENSATSGGAIFNFPNSSIVMTRTVISANTAQYGAGIYNQHAALTVDDCVLRGNVATRFGGGIDNRGGSVAVNNSVLSDNSVTYLEGTGGAVNNVYDADIRGRVDDERHHSYGEQRGQRGGGLFSNGDVQLLRVTFDHNVRRPEAPSTTKARSSWTRAR